MLNTLMSLLDISEQADFLDYTSLSRILTKEEIEVIEVTIN